MAARDRFTTRRYTVIRTRKRLILIISLVLILMIWELVRILKINNPPQISTPNKIKTNASSLSRQTSILLKYRTKVPKNAVISIETGKLYNPGGFQYPNSQLCSSSKRNNNEGQHQPLKLLILVTSAPLSMNGDRRDSIRASWGQYIGKNRSDVRLAFVLGRLKVKQERSSVKTKIKGEMKMYNDLIIGNFVDSYDNLTLKTMSLLEWTKTYCSEARYLLKTDDDAWVNVPHVLKIIDRIDKQNGELKMSKNRIYGNLTKIWTGPYREFKSKYFVSKIQYPNSSFPAYIYGAAYLIPGGKLVEDLFVEGLKTKFLWLEDAFLTGVVAEGMGVKRVHLDKFYVQRHAFGRVSKERNNRTKCEIAKWAVVHLLRIRNGRVSVKEEQENLWRVLKEYEGEKGENCSVYTD